MPKLIGIAGKKGVGKDTAANILKEILLSNSYNHGFHPDEVHIIHFADELKLEVAIACQITIEEINRNKAVFRPILQWWGTEFKRQYQNRPFYWIDKVQARLESLMPDDVVIIPDVRFPNEWEFIVSYSGSKMIYIERRLADTNDTHASENSISPDTYIFDSKIYNDYSMLQLNHTLQNFVDNQLFET